jgi:trimeric autotransporter adhesin
MSRMKLSLSVWLLFLVCSAVSLCAQQAASAAANAVVPPVVKFNGVLTDVNSKALNGTVGVTFSLYKDTQGGAALWVETQNVTPDKTGHYSVMLGSTSSQGLPSDLFNSGEARWLGVQVQGQAEQPRTLLMSVPYALKALDAETVGGKPASSFMLTPQAGGKSAAPGKLPPGTITGSGTADFIPRFTGSTTIGNSNIFETIGGNVGIATTTPAAKLDVKGTEDVRNTLTLFPSGTHPTLSVHGTAFEVSSTGLVTFASGQTFPGTGTVTSVASGTGLTGGPITRSGTLSVDSTKVPLLATANTFTANQSINGSLSAGLSVAGQSAVYGTNSSTASASGTNGVQGQSYSPLGSGTVGENYGGGYGVYGYGGTGVWGTTNSATGYGVEGSNTSSTAGAVGVYGSSIEGYGVEGILSGSSVGYGVLGLANSSSGQGGGFYNYSTGDALFTYNGAGGYAAYLDGNVYVNGNLSKASGSFQIDHPLDPANKYLYHSFVESPDMKNIYDGNVTTDGSGLATVTLPDWFEALNRDFRYQLTVIGQFAQAIVASKVSNHRFTIQTDKPNVEVSWQVTGIRQDAWANAHRIPVEVPKAPADRGLYLHPELFGAPVEKSMAVAHHPMIPKLQTQAAAKPKILTK